MSRRLEYLWHWVMVPYKEQLIRCDPRLSQELRCQVRSRWRRRTRLVGRASKLIPHSLELLTKIIRI